MSPANKTINAPIEFTMYASFGSWEYVLAPLQFVKRWLYQTGQVKSNGFYLHMENSLFRNSKQSGNNSENECQQSEEDMNGHVCHFHWTTDLWIEERHKSSDPLNKQSLINICNLYGKWMLLNTWHPNTMMADKPIQECSEYKLGIGGLAMLCELKTAIDARSISTMIAPNIDAWANFKFFFLAYRMPRYKIIAENYEC